MLSIMCDEGNARAYGSVIDRIKTAPAPFLWVSQPNFLTIL